MALKRLERVSVLFDPSGNPELARLINAMRSTDNDQRWPKFKGAGSILESTGDREVVDLTVETVEVEIEDVT